MRSDIVFKKEDTKAETPTNKRFVGHLGYIWALLNWKNRFILSGGRDKTLKVWNIEGEEILKIEPHSNSILDIIQVGENQLATCSRDKQIIVHEFKENEMQMKEVCRWSPNP